jgi:hypothetical protein
MTGSILALKVKGRQDEYMTNNPQYSFLVREYKNHVDFAVEQTPLYFYENVDFGKKITIQVPKRGDFLHKMYFCFSLPTLVKVNGTYACWTNSIGHAIIDYIDLEIGNKRIDRHYGLFMEIWEELTGKNQNENLMIGKTSSSSALAANAETESVYEVPLRFFFCNHLWAALPLLCMQYHQVKIIIKLKEFSECVSYDGTVQPTPVSINSSYILTEYVYIDETEKIRYKSSKKRLIITQCQTTDNLGEGYNPAGGVFRIDIPFNHPVKELLWVFIEDESVNNNDWFNFSYRNNVPFTKVRGLMKNCKLTVEGKEMCEQKNEVIYRYVNTERYHTNRTDRYIYCISFCENPENLEPSGSLNFSKLDSVFISGDMQTPIAANRAYLFGINYNWMVFENGLSSLDFIS